MLLIGRGKRLAKGEDVMKFCVSSSGCGKVQSARACRWDPQPLLPQWLPKAKGQSMDALEHILRLAYTYILSSSAAVSIALTVPFPPRQ